MTQEELNVILESHKKWLIGDPDGVRADLSYQDLSTLTLTNANLTDAVCTGANFFEADVGGVNFQGADLKGACFKDCMVKNCNFLGANLINSDLRNTYLFDTRFDLADLTKSDVSYSKASNIGGGLAVLEDINTTASNFLSEMDTLQVIETEVVDLE